MRRSVRPVRVLADRRIRSVREGVGEPRRDRPGWGHVWEADLGDDGVGYAIDETCVTGVDFDEAHALERGEFESRAPDPSIRGLAATFE